MEAGVCAESVKIENMHPSVHNTVLSMVWPPVVAAARCQHDAAEDGASRGILV